MTAAHAWIVLERAAAAFVPRHLERRYLVRLARAYGDAREADARAAVAIERHVDSQLGRPAA